MRKPASDAKPKHKRIGCRPVRRRILPQATILKAFAQWWERALRGLPQEQVFGQSDPPVKQTPNFSLQTETFLIEMQRQRDARNCPALVAFVILAAWSAKGVDAKNRCGKLPGEFRPARLSRHVPDVWPREAGKLSTR
jgi:hypothetical protein